MEYAMVKIYFLGSDDVNFQGFMVTQVESKKDLEKQVLANLTSEFEQGSGWLEISHSDNNQTTFDTIDEVWNTLTFKKVTEDEFKTLSKFLANDRPVVKYGHVPSFLDYEMPKPEKAVKQKIK
jgi:hypothetical protein